MKHKDTANPKREPEALAGTVPRPNCNRTGATVDLGDIGHSGIVRLEEAMIPRAGGFGSPSARGYNDEPDKGRGDVNSRGAQGQGAERD